ncbi:MULTISPECIES: hypothetical protein [Streptomyces]|uniref:Secreted protein n=1 Tax=Streptomyces canarius TaxID=285453 RepID=A0ABQ3DAX7_9ACTN|nr:hypothetical protein [Streptomyces canarius]GHA70512.1 hypothetical protein GCM10010345_87320 [Streptomyces canarius]
MKVSRISVVTGVAGAVMALGIAIVPAQAQESSAASYCGSTGDWSSDGGAYAEFDVDCVVGTGENSEGIVIDGYLHDYAKDGLGPRLYVQALTPSGTWGPTTEAARNSNGYNGPPAPIYFATNASGFNARFKVCNGGVSSNCSGWFGV